MALIPNPRPDTYGGVRVSEEGWVTGFTRAGTPGVSFHFVGVQVAEARVFETLSDNVPAESVNALYPALIAREPHAVGAYVSGARFHDIGTPADYLQTSLVLAAREGDRLVSGRGCRIADSARLTRTAVWDDVTIGRDASLDECIVCDGVRIPDGARYERVAIAPARASPPGGGAYVDGALLIKPI
jgi:NDP-sugar pyrophosphorylase family protein